MLLLDVVLLALLFCIKNIKETDRQTDSDRERERERGGGGGGETDRLTERETGTERDRECRKRERKQKKNKKRTKERKRKKTWMVTTTMAEPTNDDRKTAQTVLRIYRWLLQSAPERKIHTD